VRSVIVREIPGTRFKSQLPAIIVTCKSTPDTIKTNSKNYRSKTGF